MSKKYRISQQRTHQIVKKLLNENLISFYESGARRNKYLKLTETGIKVIQDRTYFEASIMNQKINKLDKNKVIKFYNSLNSLMDDINEKL